MHGINISLAWVDPAAMFRYYAKESFSPTNYNWGHWLNEEASSNLRKAQNTFDPAKQDAIMASIHEKVVDDAVLIWVVHDTNPHALSRKVKGYTQAQHWFQDLTTIGV